MSKSGLESGDVALGCLLFMLGLANPAIQGFLGYLFYFWLVN